MRATSPGSGTCSAWADQSGGGHHATQGTSGNRPTISTSGGTASLSFGGSQWLLCTPTSASSVKTIYAVITPTVGSGVLMFAGNQTGMAAIGAWSTVHQGNDGTAWRNTGVTYASGRQRLSYEMQTSGMTFRKNGSAASPTTWSTNPTFGANFTIGAGGPFTWAYSGHMLALYLYAAAYNSAVESYITQEWGA